MNRQLVYHITHIRNLPTIIENDLLSDNLIDDYCCIGDRGIKNSRKNKFVAIPGNPRINKSVGDFVPFYFGTRSPMLYKIKNGSVEGYDSGQEPIIYLTFRMKILWDEYTCCASSHNAACNLANFMFDWDTILAEIDWELMKSQYWNRTPDDPNRMQRRMAEFLVLDKVKFKDIAGIYTFSDEICEEVKEILRSFDLRTPVKVMTSWYY